MSAASEGRRELHLHIGLPKTGTSSIQAALSFNREALATGGFILAPMLDPRLGAHHDLFLLEEREDPEALTSLLTSTEGRRLLASSEYFSRMLRDPARLAALAEALRKSFDVRICLLIRRQDLQKESGYAQSMKVARIGPIRPAPDPVAATVWEANFYHDPDYERVIGNLEHAFGRDALRIGVFDTAREGNALDWFVELLGVGTSLARHALRRRSRAPPPRLRDARRLLALTADAARCARRNTP